MLSALSTCSSCGISSYAGSRSTPIGTPPKMIFLNNFKRLCCVSEGSRFDADPHTILQTIRIGQRRLIRAEVLNRLMTGSE